MFFHQTYKSISHLMSICRLAIPRDIFKICERFEGQCVPWWPEVRREAAVMSEAVIWMHASLTAPVAPTIFATDARGASADPRGG